MEWKEKKVEIIPLGVIVLSVHKDELLGRNGRIEKWKVKMIGKEAKQKLSKEKEREEVVSFSFTLLTFQKEALKEKVSREII